MTLALLEKAEKAVLHVIDEKPMTVAETVDKASKEAKVSADELEAAVYLMLNQGRIKLDKQYRLKRASRRAE